MGRKPCCSKVGLNKGAWSAMEDTILTSYIHSHGDRNWRALPLKAGLKRCGKSCRLRWLNYLRPDIKRGNISPEEEDLIIKLHNLLGNRWSLIAGRLPGRTDNEIKNYWNTTLCKKMDNPHQATNVKEESTNNAQLKAERHEVIRTKAVRCTKVTIPKELDVADHHPNFLVRSSELNYETPASSSSTHHSNFLMGYDIDERLVPDIMNPCFEHTYDVEENQFWRSAEEFNHNEPIDFKALASFLDSEIS